MQVDLAQQVRLIQEELEEVQLVVYIFVDLGRDMVGNAQGTIGGYGDSGEFSNSTRNWAGGRCRYNWRSGNCSVVVVAKQGQEDS